MWVCLEYPRNLWWSNTQTSHNQTLNRWNPNPQTSHRQTLNQSNPDYMKPSQYTQTSHRQTLYLTSHHSHGRHHFLNSMVAIHFAHSRCWFWFWVDLQKLVCAHTAMWCPAFFFLAYFFLPLHLFFVRPRLSFFLIFKILWGPFEAAALDRSAISKTCVVRHGATESSC